MSEVVTCSCGIRTREPFYINGQVVCAVCAETIAPRLVQSRAVANWQAFTATNRRHPTTPGYRAVHRRG